MINRKTIKKIVLSVVLVVTPTSIIVGNSLFSSSMYLKFYKTPIDAAPISFINAYKGAVDNGAEIVIAPGFTHKDKIELAYQSYASDFNNSGFFLLDESTTPKSAGINNSWSISFRSDLGSFRTGVAASYFLNENRDFFKQNDGKLNFGMYGGMDYSSITSFMGGFQQGVIWFNENIAGKEKIKGELAEKIEEYAPPTWNAPNFAGDFGPSSGTQIIEAYLKDNTLDLFMPVAGAHVWAAQSTIIQRNLRTFLIGVDNATENDRRNIKSPFNVGSGMYVQFSSEKKLDKAVEIALDIVNNGNIIHGLKDQYSDIKNKTINPKYSNFVDEKGLGGFGTNAVGTIENGTVGISAAGQKYYDAALNLINLKSDAENDPSLDQSLSTDAKMIYTDKADNNKVYKYGPSEKFKLNQKFEDLKPTKRLNKKNFLENKGSKKEDKLKIVLGSSVSILMDGSFSEASYFGMYKWYKKHGVEIPPPPAFK